MPDLREQLKSALADRYAIVREVGRGGMAVVYLAEEPAAAALVVGSGNTLRVPWASSLRKHAALGPNMLLYLRLLEHACTSGYRVFDFGRSTPGEGTFRFKEQWGAVPVPLFWHALSLDGSAPAANDKGGTGFELAARYWKKLPLAVTRIVGPRIRMHISL